MFSGRSTVFRGFIETPIRSLDHMVDKVDGGWPIRSQQEIGAGLSPYSRCNVSKLKKVVRFLTLASQ